LEWYSVDKVRGEEEGGGGGGEEIGVGKEPGLNFLVRNRIGRKGKITIILI
jgi:hypothetical protein